MTNLSDVLKTTNSRLEVGRRWLVWDGSWFVYYQPYGEKVRCIYNSSELTPALAVLVTEVVDDRPDS